MSKFLWLDLEMSGLQVASNVIIEAAAIVTNDKWEQLATYHSVVRQPQFYIDRMDEWNRTHHTKSGLIEQIPRGKPPELVEEELMTLIDQHFSETDKPILAGNSIHLDRNFIDFHWPRLAERLHYRMLDVTSWKLVLKSIFGVEYEKGDSHRALDDIQESINELKTYLSYIKTDKIKKLKVVK